MKTPNLAQGGPRGLPHAFYGESRVRSLLSRDPSWEQHLSPSTVPHLSRECVVENQGGSKGQTVGRRQPQRGPSHVGFSSRQDERGLETE